MNVVPALETDAGEVWDSTIRSVNAWRGHALQCFAQAEAAVSETLLALAAVPDRGGKIRLRRLVGQRFEDMRMAIADDGPFAAEGQKAVRALALFLQHEHLRPLLSHGVAKVALDRQDQWVVIFRLLAFRGRLAERSGEAFEQREAEALLAGLKARTQQLCSALLSLRARLQS